MSRIDVVWAEARARQAEHGRRVAFAATLSGPVRLAFESFAGLNGWSRPGDVVATLRAAARGKAWVQGSLAEEQCQAAGLVETGPDGLMLTKAGAEVLAYLSTRRCRRWP